MQNEVGSATIFPLTWNWAGGEELTMLISIDVIRYGAGYDAAGHWHEAKADYVSPQEQEEERAIMAPARGAICGAAAERCDLGWAGGGGAGRADANPLRTRNREKAFRGRHCGALFALGSNREVYGTSGGSFRQSAEWSAAVSSFASTTESSVVGRPLQSLFAPREFLLPAGALRSVVVEHGSGAEVAGLGVSVRAGVMGVSPANDRR